MEQTQLIRTDIQNKKIQTTASQKAAQGDAQTGMFDAAQESNEHMKKIEQEKMLIYGAAVGALITAHGMIPSAEDLPALACKKPEGITLPQCVEYTKKYSGALLANKGAKSAIGAGIAKFTAKAIASGLKASMFGKSAQQIAAAKKSVTAEEGNDLMMDRCAFNPTDPACAKPGSRVSGPGFKGPEFGMGDGGNNSFNMTPGSEIAGEDVVATDIGPTNPIADVNSPFVDDAKSAKDILNPAGAAQFQATGGAQGGGAGGGGGGLGGGGASLGSDIDPADKDGNKEPQIKAGNVSGTYAQGGGAGYKGVGRGKDDANPFASLFDAKSNGGVEEDRSIASGDIDGKASGLFQKISKRYGQIQADKRIEANNLE